MEKNNWIIVYTAAGKFVGRQVHHDSNNDDINLEPAFTWINEQVMVGPGQMGMMRQVVPLQSTLDASNLNIKKYIAIQHLDSWNKESKNKILDQIKNVIDGMKKESAKNVGITLPSSNFKL